MMDSEHDRRDFMRIGAAAGTAWAIGQASLAAESADAKVRQAGKVRVGFVGIGARGTVLLKVLLDLEGVEIRAVCDIIEQRVVKAQDMVTAAGQRKPNGYSRSETDFQRLCETEELDLVINHLSIPWSIC
jgi:predicted homoserine dehydrogenase-like protein